MSEFFDNQVELVAKLTALGVQYKFGTYDGAIPSGEHLRSTNGRYWPYVVYALGGKSEVRRDQQGIVSSADDVKWTSLVIFCVGDTPTTVRRLKDLLRTEFEGYIHGPGWGEFVEILTGDFGISKPDPDLIPLRFGESLAFKAMVDL
jgi:hypothetical protein